MKAIEMLVRTPLAASLGWTVIHSLWQGALIAAALAAALLALRTPRARYGAACLAMLAMTGAFAITFVRELPEGTSGAEIRQAFVYRGPDARAGAAAAPSWQPELAAAAPWLAPFWLIGVWIFYLRHAAACISVARLRRRGVCCAPQRWVDELARLRARLRLSRPVALLESSLAETPVVLGHFRPLILMPAGVLTGLPPAQVEAILLHELAHVRRHDYLVNLLARSIEGLMFYHPAMWWIAKVIRTERENVCDDVAVAISGDAHRYAVALAALEQNRCAPREPAMAATGGSLMKRIHRLLYPKGPNGGWMPALGGAIMIATAAVAMAAWQPGPAAQNGDAGAGQTKAAPSPYLNWLNEDVVYIITPRERTAFLKLKTDEERDHFIEQFWERRNPTPGAPENEFKKEHYRRIAYANRHFASGVPGWETDRGRIYIVYGPPDEIDAHPSGTGTEYPFEVWTYRHVEGIGDNVSVRFVDRSGTGDYRIAPGNSQ
jgi:bla regulator protein blaR1